MVNWACIALILGTKGSSVRFLCDDSGTADAVPLSEKEKDDENTKSSIAQKAQMLSDWGQSSAAGLFDNVGSLVSHMRRVGRSGKLARRNSTSLIDGKEQKVAGVACARSCTVHSCRSASAGSQPAQMAKCLGLSNCAKPSSSKTARKKLVCPPSGNRLHITWYAARSIAMRIILSGGKRSFLPSQRN